MPLVIFVVVFIFALPYTLLFMKKSMKVPHTTSAVKLVRKANELVEARYKFDIWETRVFAKMLTMVKPGDENFQLYDIHVGDLLKDFNLEDQGYNYASVKQATKKLLTRVIEIERETPEGVKWYAMPLLVGAQGFKEPRDGNYISVQFHHELKPYLLELKERYLQYDIRNLWGLSSVYSVRMYELLKQYEKIGKRFFTLEDLRTKLAIELTEYLKYNHFKDKVLLKAQGDLGNSTDIAFSMEEHKQGKRVTAITFFISANSEHPGKAIPEKIHTEIQVIDQVKEWGITEETLNALVAKYGMERVKNGVSCTTDNLKNAKIKESSSGFFIKAVEQDWKSGDQAKREKMAENQRRKAEKKTQTIGEIMQLEAQLEDLLLIRRAEANDIIKALTHDDAFLAGEAVGKIVENKMVKLALEKETSLKLEGLGMDEWRNNKPLRDAVVRQIEAMYPVNFKEIQAKFDGSIKQLRAQVETLKKVAKG